MKIVTQMLVMDQRNRRPVAVTVVTPRATAPSTEASDAARLALRASARTHAGRLSLPARG